MSLEILVPENFKSHSAKKFSFYTFLCELNHKVNYQVYDSFLFSLHHVMWKFLTFFMVENKERHFTTQRLLFLWLFYESLLHPWSFFQMNAIWSSFKDQINYYSSCLVNLSFKIQENNEDFAGASSVWIFILESSV